jgi:hypothetical protein
VYGGVFGEYDGEEERIGEYASERDWPGETMP